MDTIADSATQTARARPLAGKGALVTGSTSGIGLGIARGFAGAGADLVLNGFGDAADIARLRDELERGFEVSVAYSGADMSRPDEIAAMIDEAARHLSAVDILVNNAGVQHVAPLASFPPEKWDLVLRST